MDAIKIAFSGKSVSSGDKLRGIGFQTKETIKAIRNLKKANIKLDVVDFDSEDLSKYDIVHFPKFHPFFNSLSLFSTNRAKVVVTIDDLVPLIYKKNYPSGLRGYLSLQIQKALLKKVDAVITISETSKKDVIRLLKLDPSKVHVSHLAPRKIFKKITNSKKLDLVRKKYNLPKSFILYVGDVNYNKNIEALTKASTSLGIDLVIVGKQAKSLLDEKVFSKKINGPMDLFRFLIGKPHPEEAHYSGLIKSIKQPNVTCTGFVDDSDLVGIYNLASVYVQPSIYEGFGLPLVEAMACGVPTVIPKTQALVEVSNGVSLVSKSTKAKDLEDAIRKLVSSKTLRNLYAEKSLNRAKMFTWKKTATKIVSVYEKICKI